MNKGYKLVYTESNEDSPETKVFVFNLTEVIERIKEDKIYAGFGSDIYVCDNGIVKRIRVVLDSSGKPVKGIENLCLIASTDAGLLALTKEVGLNHDYRKINKP
jgi:hypothetical protein